jgi:hypothetical protein
MEAGSKFFGVAVISWLNPLGEIFERFGSVVDNISLMGGNVINHLFGSNVEVLSESSTFWGFSLMFKFCHVLFHEFHGLLPVSSGSKFSVV